MAERLYPQPYPLLNHENMLDLVQWFTTRALAIQPAIPADAGAGILTQDERMQLDWFNLQDTPFQAMQAAALQLSGLKRNIPGLKIILAVLYEQSLGARKRKEAASAQVFAALPEATPVLLQ